MNAVEIEQAMSALAEQAFDDAEFPFAFLRAACKVSSLCSPEKSDPGDLCAAKQVGSFARRCQSRCAAQDRRHRRKCRTKDRECPARPDFPYGGCRDRFSSLSLPLMMLLRG